MKIHGGIFPGVLLPLFFCFSGCAASSGSRKVQLYQDSLAALLQHAEPEIHDQLVKSWSFEILDRWKGKDPSVETVLKNNYRIHGFTRQEAQDVFSTEGDYKVEIYLKLLSSEGARLEQINEMGQTVPTARHTLADDTYAYVRVVFRDEKLVHASAWSR